MSAYFRDVWVGVTTVLAGMWVTFRHLFEPNITIQYPRVKKEMFPNTRAALVNHTDMCSCCLSCARVCPVNIIKIQGVKAAPDEDLGTLPDGKPKKMHVVQYDIDLSKCIFCGLCVDACKEQTGSLRWEAPQDPSVFTRAEMMRHFSTYSLEERDRLIKRAEEQKAAAAVARAAKKAATAAKKKKLPLN
ncbi:MAG: 4Fe-4S dicluster domain-containing protein [Candidatus Electryoneaceae bacterium]|nr:4Fe-4S dicluster domain-containing protein [Candidatus Electryoneaceae bacterium]